MIPIYDPSLAGWPRAHLRWGLRKPRHGLGPRGLRAETLSPSRGRGLTCAELKWDGVPEGTSSAVLGPLTHSYPLCPWVVVHEQQHQSMNLSTLQSLGEPGLHPKGLEDSRQEGARGVGKGEALLVFSLKASWGAGGSR